MQPTFIVKDFSGPLDLLLSLINEKEMNISEVSMAAVTDQFLEYLETLPEKQPDVVADFLVIATRLLYLKARALLPQIVPEDAEGPSLADQLRLYQRFVEASRAMNDRWLSGNCSFARYEPTRVVVGSEPPSNMTRTVLHEVMQKVIERLRPPKPLPRAMIDKTVSLKEKIDIIRQLLQRRKSFNFFDTVAKRTNRTDLIVSFLAILELMKQELVRLRQPTAFGDILVERG